MRVLYVSGYSESDISDQGVIDPDLKSCKNRLPHRALVRKVRELLDAKPADLRWSAFREEEEALVNARS